MHRVLLFQNIGPVANSLWTIASAIGTCTRQAVHHLICITVLHKLVQADQRLVQYWWRTGVFTGWVIGTCRRCAPTLLSLTTRDTVCFIPWVTYRWKAIEIHYPVVQSAWSISVLFTSYSLSKFGWYLVGICCAHPHWRLSRCHQFLSDLCFDTCF